MLVSGIAFGKLEAFRPELCSLHDVVPVLRLYKAVVIQNAIFEERKRALEEEHPYNFLAIRNMSTIRHRYR